MPEHLTMGGEHITKDVPTDGGCTHGYLELNGNTRCPKPATGIRVFPPTGREYPCCDEHRTFSDPRPSTLRRRVEVDHD